MSLRLVPSPSHPTSANNTSSTSKGAPSAPGLPDPLRAALLYNPYTPTPTSTDPPPQTTSTHPLESRLAAWTATQENLKMQGLRRTFGIAEPVRRGMEMKIARQGEWRPAVLGGSAGVSGEVLAGRDCECGWEDVFRGDETREAVGFHTEMEAKMRMDW